MRLLSFVDFFVCLIVNIKFEPSASFAPNAIGLILMPVVSLNLNLSWAADDDVILTMIILTALYDAGVRT
ncbi:hypothetical protein GCM10027037_08420 [Mucilaginibacter koreensis]